MRCLAKQIKMGKAQRKEQLKWNPARISQRDDNKKKRMNAYGRRTKENEEINNNNQKQTTQ